MDVLTDNEVRFLAGKIAERLQQGISREAIIADVAGICGLEWAEAFQEEVEQEMRDYASGPKGRGTLRRRVRQRMRPAWVGLAFGAVALLVAFPLAGDTRIAVMSGGAVVLAVGVGGLVVAAWQLRSLA